MAKEANLLPISSVIKQKDEEGYHLSLQEGTFQLKANNELSMAFGLSHLKQSIQSNTWPGQIGENKPLFSDRVLCLTGEISVKLDNNLTISLPTYFLNEVNLQKACKRIVSLGYNHVLLGESCSMNQSIDHKHLSSLLEKIPSFGLKLWIKPTLALPDQSSEISWRETIKDSLSNLMLHFPFVDALVWEMGMTGIGKNYWAKEWIEKEIAQSELALIEDVVKGVRMIYWISSQSTEEALKQSVWIPELLDQAGKLTTIAFSFYAGKFYSDYLPLNPFWETLSKSPDSSGTPLLPIINCGGVSQGEGLWPIFTGEPVDRFIHRAERHLFQGAIIVSPQLPNEGGLLECNLLAASCALWRGKSTEVYREAWFAAYFPDDSYQLVLPYFDEARNLLLHMRKMTNLDFTQTECMQIFLDSLYARLKSLSVQVLLITSPFWKEIFDVFIRDVKRHMMVHFRTQSVTLSKWFTDKDVGEGFWSQVASDSQIPTQRSIDILITPNKGPAGSIMESIYHLNRFES